MLCFKKCLFVILILLPFTLAAGPQDDLYSALLGLASEEDQVRQDALSSMEQIGGELVNELFDAYKLGEIYLWNDKVILTDGIHQDSKYVKHIKPIDVFTKEYIRDSEFLLPLKSVEELSADRQERKLMASSQMLVQLTLDDKKIVGNAIRRSSNDDRATEAIPYLEELSRSGPSRSIRFGAAESLAIIKLKSTPHLDLNVVDELGKLKSLRGFPLLEDILKQDDLSAIERERVTSAVNRIQGLKSRIKIFDVFKSALSTGSILILMALGLAITFGMMGIINMAHGEMMMIGAYTTYCIQLLFGHTPENPVSIFYFFALPLSFLVSALVGGLIEWSVVKRLYKKPIESLLATYGISLILVQVIRLLFGDNRATNSPSWLQGAINFSQGFSIPINRIFILVVAIAAVVAVWAVLKYTRLGLNMRATMQNRDMAAAMGINTRRVDSFTFMLGSGIAGVAGYALTTVGGITPDMGGNYIIDSFLVVVTGGVGSLAGVVSSGMGIGFIIKLLEGTLFGAVWAKIIVLLLVILFIQFRPQGLFAPKGRLADD